MMHFIVNKRTDEQKNDVNLLHRIMISPTLHALSAILDSSGFEPEQVSAREF